MVIDILVYYRVCTISFAMRIFPCRFNILLTNTEFLFYVNTATNVQHPPVCAGVAARGNPWLVPSFPASLPPA